MFLFTKYYISSTRVNVVYTKTNVHIKISKPIVGAWILFFPPGYIEICVMHTKVANKAWYANITSLRSTCPVC